MTSPSSNGQPKNDLINQGYPYTRAGNIAIITDFKKDNEEALTRDIFDYAYQYDRLHRFTSEATTNSIYNPVAHMYNAIGNILTNNVGSARFAYTYDPTKMTDIWHVDRGLCDVAVL